MDIEFIMGMIGAYVPDADGLSFEAAFVLATERDAMAAELLAADVETQLHMEEAARICNDLLDTLPEPFTGEFIGMN